MIPMYEYFDDLYGESLEHHGILGMKWGIRRFQNKDGSLTPAGKKQAEKRAAKEAKNKAKTKEQEAKEKAKTEEREAKAAAKAEAAEKKLREDIDKAIANVDMKQLSKLKSSMSDEDLKRFAARAQSLGQVGVGVGNYNKNLPPSAYERVLSGISGLKAGVDAATGLKQSLRAAKAEFFPKKKEAEGDNQNNQNNQNNKKQNDNAVTSKQMDDRFEKMMNRLTKEVTTLVKERPKDQNGGKQEKQPKQEPKQKEKKLGSVFDLWEDENDPRRIGTYSAPKLGPLPSNGATKIGLSSIPTERRVATAALGSLRGAFKEKTLDENRSLPKVSKIFSDAGESAVKGLGLSKSQVRKYNESKPDGSTSLFQSIGRTLEKHREEEAARAKSLTERTLSGARDTALSTIAKRNSSGWTASNNDDWLSVLRTASTLTVTDGEWNKYNKYK